MQFIIHILKSAIEMISELYAFLVLARFLFQLAKVDFYNPISQLIVKITDPVLYPLRKIIPCLYSIDISAILLVIIIQTLLVSLKLLPNNPSWDVRFVFGCLIVIKDILNVYLCSMVVLAVTSWIFPQTRSALVLVLYQLIEPIVGRIRQIIPAFSGIDFSYMIFAFIIYAIKQYMFMQFPFLLAM